MKNATSGDCGLTPICLEAIHWARAEAGEVADVADILSRLRYAHLVRIRRLAAWRLRVNHRLSFPRIARLFRRDHATIMHHVERENEARGLPTDYPQGIWRAERETALRENIDIIAKRIDAGAFIEDVAYEYRIPTQCLRIELKAFRRKTVDGLLAPRAEHQTTDRIASEPFGAMA